MFRNVGSLWAEAHELFLPALCLSCQDVGGPLCEVCFSERALELIPKPWDAALGAMALPLREGVLPRVIAGVKYEGLNSSIMLGYKNKSLTSFLPLVSKWLGAGFEELGCAPGDVVIPVPGTHSAYMRRGYDPLHLMLQHLGVGIAGGEFSFLEVLLLQRRRKWRGYLPRFLRHGGSGQKGLGPRQRQERLRGEFFVSSKDWDLCRNARRIIVIDDVLTTGATLASAMRAIYEILPPEDGPGVEGVEVLGVVALAARGHEDGRESVQQLSEQFPANSLSSTGPRAD